MLLAIDTSTQMIGLALYDGVQVLGETTWYTKNHHTTELSPAVSDLLARCNVPITDLSALGVALGPGSFTGLRIGLALVKGIAFALKIPVVGVPTLDVLATAVPLVAMPLAAVLQAGRGRLALVWYDARGTRWKARGEPVIITPEELVTQITQPTRVAGELTAADRQVLARHRKLIKLASPALSLRRPGFLAELAWNRFRAGRVDDVVSLAPIYVHLAGAAIPD